MSCLQNNTSSPYRAYLLLTICFLIFWFVTGSPTYTECRTKEIDFAIDSGHSLDVLGTGVSFFRCQIQAIDENEGFVVGFFTAVLAASTIFLWLATRNLAIRAIAQEKISRDQVEQLRKASEHTEKTERAYVTMRADDPGLPTRDGGKWRPVIRVKNFGKTPARITDAPMWHQILPRGQNPPLPLFYPADRGIPKAFLVANEEFYFFHPIKFDANVESGDQVLWVYGHVDYIDISGTRHRSGWARKYKPKRNALSLEMRDVQGINRTVNLIFVTDESYNYDRPRQVGEGNDWDL